MKKFNEYKQLDLAALSREVLAQWEAEHLFEKSVTTREGHTPFLFFEGPPSANGMPGAKEEVDLYDYGVTLGLRYYFGAHHKGWYIEPQFMFERVTLDYTYDYKSDSYYYRDPDEDANVSGNLLGGGAVIGYKIMSGKFTMSSDIGYAYRTISLKGRSRDDVEEASAVGAGFTGNVTAGFAF